MFKDLQMKYYGSSKLTTVSKPIDDINEEVCNLAKNMLVKMYEEQGVGLAAPQVGINKRLIVIDCGEPWQKMPYIMINPVIIEKHAPNVFMEGCLSFPGIEAEVKRYNFVKVQFLDLKKKVNTLKAAGLLAQCIQHEIEHLDGVLFIDNAIKPIEKEKLLECKQKIQELI